MRKCASSDSMQVPAPTNTWFALPPTHTPGLVSSSSRAAIRVCYTPITNRHVPENPAMPNQTEPNANNALGDILRDMMPGSMVLSENT